MIMATILEFRSATRRVGPALQRGKSADILIFTGVRYERWEQKAEEADRKERRLHDGLLLDD